MGSSRASASPENGEGRQPEVIWGFVLPPGSHGGNRMQVGSEPKQALPGPSSVESQSGWMLAELKPSARVARDVSSSPRAREQARPFLPPEARGTRPFAHSGSGSFPGRVGSY